MWSGCESPVEQSVKRQMVPPTPFCPGQRYSLESTSCNIFPVERKTSQGFTAVFSVVHALMEWGFSKSPAVSCWLPFLSIKKQRKNSAYQLERR
ncbi:hypothetical protein CDAR_504691 [Caerostris darwini]|uniref:Uncharacterized protein n=1 Tax=Caerostris darwini TaxID=1538125 RepID=A0AAV4SCA3_9ARAC|nr:hypothetical protein CDAR_504691 [Caerostris darwini]